MNNNDIYSIQLSYHAKKYADLRGFFPPLPSAPVDKILLDVHNSSHQT